MRWRLQPYVVEAATLSGGGCNHIWYRLQPYVAGAVADLEHEGALRVRRVGRVRAARLDAEPQVAHRVLRVVPMQTQGRQICQLLWPRSPKLTEAGRS